ncbi:type II toxin-antitoxin system VapB family antitoxin [Segetibacter aerophilus]|uniref:DUF2281 domain-containing protein n=1 Tax=Segetibacter aerophilus TaxID=670293 RepID=A0A512BCZ3_9BACT|nr:DUF2281 domain-containing protein [Segetibacter aerophilus]GEO09832.1 hypothetical protein SAE01_23280 [Segetibacter aerophilus]
MSDLAFLETVKLMPPDYQQEVKDFIEFVWEKKLGKEPLSQGKRIPGLFKGKMWMSPDFDEPLEDFKDYM